LQYKQGLHPFVLTLAFIVFFRVLIKHKTPIISNLSEKYCCILLNFYYLVTKTSIMNDIIIVSIAIFILIAAIVIYGVVSTSMGYEEDVNKNYIPDRLERMLGMDPKAKKDEEV